MKRSALWRLSLPTPTQGEEAVADALASALGETPVSYTDLKTGRTTVAVYFRKKPDWSAAGRSRIVAHLEGALKLKPRAILARLSLIKLQNEDWAESWKRHFKPLLVGNRLLIRPSWSKRRPTRGQAVVQLDPGMSFGTGQHPTTGFCLRELTRLRKPGSHQSLLDLGTGSGILAISAAKLGYAPVEAVEVDPDCVRIALSNARLNAVNRLVTVRCQDLNSLTRTKRGTGYSVVCANLMADLLIAEKKRLRALCLPGGHLVIAGILAKEFLGVRSAYESLGFKLKRGRNERGWHSGCFSCEF